MDAVGICCSLCLYYCKYMRVIIYLGCVVVVIAASPNMSHCDVTLLIVL